MVQNVNIASSVFKNISLVLVYSDLGIWFGLVFKDSNVDP